MTQHQFIRMSSILLTVAVLFLGLALQTQAAAPTAASSNIQQRQIDPEIHVALTPGGPKKYVIASTLSLPPTRTTTIIVTYHGSTYGQYYWNFPYKPGTYSFVDAMTKAGFAVLNIDRIGDGNPLILQVISLPSHRTPIPCIKSSRICARGILIIVLLRRLF